MLLMTFSVRSVLARPLIIGVLAKEAGRPTAVQLLEAIRGAVGDFFPGLPHCSAP